MTIQFLVEWALRSSILIVTGALLLWALRVKDPSIRLAAWTAMMCGSLAMPLFIAAAPQMPLPVMRRAPATIEAPAANPQPVRATPMQSPTARQPFDWPGAAILLYVAIAGALLLRLCIALVITQRLLRSSRASGHSAGRIEIRESDAVASPVALGIVRPVIVLPTDWREWDAAKLSAVLAHESSHIRRNDPAVQLLSGIHRALVWHSPLSWFLHRRIVRSAEDVSDDAALAVARDRASYAELLLEFMQRGVRGAGLQGVAMARYGAPDQRIHRILTGTALSHGVTRWSAVAILALGAPVAYVAAAAHPQTAASVAAVTAAPAQTAATAGQATHAPVAASPQSGTIRRYMISSDDSTSSGSWDSSDPADEKGLREKFGRNFAWFRKSGTEYVITDPGVLDELQEAMAPQKEVNRMQNEVNRQQADVNALQSNVNALQNGVNDAQHEVNHRQELVNRIQAAANNEATPALIQKLEDALRELRASKADAGQEGVNRLQAQVNQEQARVNQEQQKVNEEQRKVNVQQRLASAAFNQSIQEIFESALDRNLARPLR